MPKVRATGKKLIAGLKNLRPKVTVSGRTLISDIKNLRLKASIATRHLVADILFGQFLLSNRFANAVGLTDILAKALGLNKTDYVNTTESISLDYSKNAYNETSITDFIAIAANKPETDNFSTTDIAYANIGKNITDEVSFIDTAILASGTGVLDTVYATDDVGAQATIDDDQYMLFGKNLIESLSISDLVSLTVAYQRTFNESVNITDLLQRGFPVFPDESLSMSEIIGLLAEKSESDTLLSADSGSLISQDYVDNNQYFDADYVGQYRTF